MIEDKVISITNKHDRQSSTFPLNTDTFNDKDT